MSRWMLFASLFLLTAPARAATNVELKEEVRRTEIAFAKSMADRDPAAFASFLSSTCSVIDSFPHLRSLFGNVLE